MLRENLKSDPDIWSESSAPSSHAKNTGAHCSISAANSTDQNLSSIRGGRDQLLDRLREHHGWGGRADIEPALLKHQARLRRGL